MMTFLQDLQAAFTYSFEKPWFFTNYSFLLVFSLFLLGYALFNKNSRWKLAYLILFSLFFYYKSSGPFLLLFVGIIICDYFLSKALHRSKGWKRSLLLLFSIAYSLSFLLYFKYTNFFIQNLNVYFSTGFEARDIFLPIGISFYTFQSLSYLIDVARKEIEPSKNLLDYSFYMTFFPHLVAGPIVRAKDFLPQINQPLSLDNSLLKEAIFKITVGLTKKLLIADFLAKYVDLVHAAPEGFSGFEHFVAMYSYSFQIYFDFSGYSDIAIGIALLLGYRLKENFQNPYIAQNITSFWRRWHISLSLWLRDYIYIPLGGNRKGTFNTYLFLLITMLVGGFWHGAEW
ncbi:MAG: MBOAT family protein, partial [Flavobacteriales bacterium]|nr:MBOAT family protein [Flavobacteriales bacterium]